MKIGIYGPYFGTMGGGELYLGSIAEILSRSHQVEIVSETDLSPADYSSHFGLDLSHVGVRIVPRIPFVESFTSRGELQRATEFTADYDLFILMPRNFRIPFPVRSNHSILHLQVPDRPWSFADFARSLGRGAFTEFRNQLVKQLRYPGRYAQFDAVLINSEFHRRIIAGRLKNPGAMVLPPPISLKKPRPWSEKQNLILSVGRFFRGLHSKRHDVLLRAFRSFAQQQPGWRLALAGGLGSDAPTQQYFNELQQLAAGLPVDFHPNAPLADLNRLYEDARIYWHAAGFQADDRSPERMEHFGISTVEAMSAGCVPLVYRAGGQMEIVQEGVNGEFWVAEAELVAKTASLLSGPQAPARSEAAVQRSREFGRDRFEQKLLQVVAQITGP